MDDKVLSLDGKPVDVQQMAGEVGSMRIDAYEGRLAGLRRVESGSGALPGAKRVGTVVGCALDGVHHASKGD